MDREPPTVRGIPAEASGDGSPSADGAGVPRRPHCGACTQAPRQPSQIQEWRRDESLPMTTENQIASLCSDTRDTGRAPHQQSDCRGPNGAARVLLSSHTLELLNHRNQPANDSGNFHLGL